MAKALNKIKAIWSNRVWVQGNKTFVVVLLLFIVWMMFFDRNRLATHYKLEKSINKLEHSIDSYNSETDILLKEQKDLNKNKEKYAREKYLMHKENEEVFVLQNK